ncbi:MAG: glycine cleavage system protein H [Deltaproteobacteria bacterium CG11_big_fil_rev_8_21_14_0_20_45_16]|nr:MAG: glycine cleavage system protein H [Deltaproteobacteria bacterium CG11_big_fil_rev_8_21_14_0_20_45_16]
MGTDPGFKVPQDVLYTKNHEWVRVEDGNVIVGITDYAQSQLGDITYVELPEEGSSFKREAVFGTVDSLKTVAELYAPVDGEVVEINSDLPNNAENVNEKPYTDGWMVKMEISNEAQLEELMLPDDYLKLISKLSKKAK